MRLVLFTELNSKFGGRILETLSASKDVSDLLVVTREDGILCSYYTFEPDAPNLKLLAERHGISVLQEEHLGDGQFRNRLAAFGPEYLFVANYQKKIDPELCNIARRAAVNFHPSPLPRYAGLAPFFWMAKNAETRGGVSCCLIADMIDSGDIIDQVPVSMSGRETAGEIRDLHFAASFAQVRRLLPHFAAGSLAPVPQDLAQRTYFGRASTQHMAIDCKAGVDAVLRTVRASAPYPGAVGRLPNGLNIRVTSADTYPHHRANVAPGTLEKIGGQWLLATVDGWIRINAIACFGADDESNQVDFQMLKLNPHDPALRRQENMKRGDVLAHLMTIPALDAGAHDNSRAFDVIS
jgi:methionyl-tRNA formyltransferase